MSGQGMIYLHVQRALAGMAIAGTLAGAAWAGSAAAHAEPVERGATIRTHEMVTNVYGKALPSVYLSELPILRECFLEDCSDIPDRAQPGIWTDSDTGDAYVLWTDGPTYIVIDR